MNKKTIRDIDVKGKKVLVRCDFNVPMKDGVITDENRIQGALPTIKYLMDHGAKVVLCSHMGKPHNVFDEKLELNKKEKAKIAALPEAEQAAATAEALEKADEDQCLMPADAQILVTDDGKYSGFIEKSGKQMLAFLPLSDGRCARVAEELKSVFLPVEKKEESANTPEPDANSAAS